MSRVGFLGTGLMGGAMARNLAAAGFDVVAWNRTAAKVEALEGVGASPTPLDAASGAEFLVTMLSDAASAEEAVTAEVLAALGENAVWVQMATVGEEIERLAGIAAAAGVTLVDAPVLGTAKPAADGTLVVLVAGAGPDRERLAPLFDAVGARTVWLDGEVGAASRLKLVLNHWVLGTLQLVVETTALAEALNVDPADFLGAIEGGPLDSAYARMRVPAVSARSLEPSFRLELARKDVGLIEQALAGSGYELALIGAIGERFDRAIALGHGDRDTTASILAVAPRDKEEE